MRLTNSSQKLLIILLTLLAFFLRIYRLDFQSYWIEEIWTLYYSRLPVSELWSALQTSEPKPPFYYFSTHYWINLFGDGEFSLRFYSLIFGVLAVPLTYRLGQALGGWRLGWLTALLITVAPFQVWYSQEARMYSIFTAASLISTWGFVKLLPEPATSPKPLRFAKVWPWWLLYSLGTAWALITHYHAVLLIGSQGLFLLLTWRRHWRYYLPWGGALIFIFLLYLPWLLVGANLVRDYLHWLPQPSLSEAYLRSLIAFSVGEYMPRPQAIPLALLFLAIYSLGLIFASRRRWGKWRGWEMAAFLSTYTLAPIFAAWFYGEVRTPAYLERYLIPMQVGFLLTVALGLLAIYDFRFTIYNLPIANTTRVQCYQSSLFPRSLATLLLATLLSINTYAVWQHYFNPAYAKDDWRAVIRTIENFSLPGDAIILTGDGGEKLFDYYYRGDLPIYLDFLTPVPAAEQARQILARIAATHRRLWYTPYGVEIDATLEAWLAQNSYPAWHRWLGRKRLALYGGSATLTERVEPVNSVFTDSAEPGLTLVSVALPDHPSVAGDLLPLTLTWQTPTPVAQDYQLSVRLINGRGDVFAQSDWPPLAAVGGTSTWTPNQPVLDRRSLWLPPDVPPGAYALQLVVYHPTSGQSLGQPLIISNITINPAQLSPPLSALPIPNFMENCSFFMVHCSLYLIGSSFPDQIQPGQEMWLWLYWQAPPTPIELTSVRVTLVDDQTQISTDFSLVDSAGPLDSWQPGQVRRAVYHLPTSPRLTGRQAQLKVALLNPARQPTFETTLGTINLANRPRQFKLPPMSQQVDLMFGKPGMLTLLGYDLPATTFDACQAATVACLLPLTLYWRAEAEMTSNYTVFVQLLDQEGQIVAQADQQPLAGAAPTTTWLPQEILTDAYTLNFPIKTPPGNYRLIAGLYQPATGERLLLNSGADFVELSLITVK